MIKNYLTIVLLAFICAFSLNELSAQDKQVTKKVVVIEKTVDDNGKVTSKKVVKEGAEADEYIKEMNLENDIDIDINIEGEGANIIKKQAYKVVTVDDNGVKKTIEWNGEGEMPAEIKEMMEKEGVEKHHHKSAYIWKSSEGDGEDQEIEIKLNGEDMTDDIKALLKEENIDITVKSDPNKAQLGVMFMETDEDMVEISDVVEESAADEAGLKSGDVIRKIGDVKIESSDHLIEVIQKHKPGDKIRVAITRDGEKTYKDVVLKQAQDTFTIKFDDGKSVKWKEVEKDVDIIIEKKK